MRSLQHIRKNGVYNRQVLPQERGLKPAEGVLYLEEGAYNWRMGLVTGMEEGVL